MLSRRGTPEVESRIESASGTPEYSFSQISGYLLILEKKADIPLGCRPAVEP